MSGNAASDAIAVVWPTAKIQWDRGVWRMTLGFRDHVGPQHGWFLRSALADDPPAQVTGIVLEESTKNSLAVLDVSGANLTDTPPDVMRHWVDMSCWVASTRVEEIKASQVPAARTWLDQVARDSR